MKMILRQDFLFILLFGWILLVESILSIHSSSSSSSSSSSLTSFCPSICTCKWKNGKKTASCVRLSLESIPDGIESDTQVLHLHDNNFQDRLTKSRNFYDLALTNLQRIYLSRCKITSLGDNLFASLTNLVELDLSENLLTAIPSDSFKATPHLRRLTLANNPIKVIDDLSFPDLESLIFLDLNDCQIEVVDATAFSGLRSLKTLLLSNNQLKILPGGVIEPLSQLQELNLHGNHWICDCHNRDLRLQMIQRNIPLSFDPACHSPPRLRRVNWSNLTLDDFACPPSLSEGNVNGVNGYKQVSYQKYSSSSSSYNSVSTSSFSSFNPRDYVQVTEGDDASLECSAESIPLPTINWSRNGQLISNLSLMSFGRQMYLLREEIKGPHEKSSKLIIINSLPKDTGRYFCNVSNKAGSVGKMLSLDVIPKKRATLPDSMDDEATSRSKFGNVFSGETLAGAIIGLLIVLLVIFLGVVYYYMKYKEAVTTNSPDIVAMNGANGNVFGVSPEPGLDGQSTVLVLYDMTTQKATSRPTNGHAHILTTTGNGHLPVQIGEGMLITSGVD